MTILRLGICKAFAQHMHGHGYMGIATSVQAIRYKYVYLHLDNISTRSIVPLAQVIGTYNLISTKLESPQPQSMNEILRDAPIGQFLRYITKNKVLQYPEEQPGFQCPKVYFTGKHGKGNEQEKLLRHGLEVIELSESRAQSSQVSLDDGQVKSTAAPLLQTETEKRTDAQEERRNAEGVPVKVKDGVVLVDWCVSLLPSTTLPVLE